MMTNAERKLLYYLAIREESVLLGNIQILEGHMNPDKELIEIYKKAVKKLKGLIEDFVNEQDKSST